MPADKVAEPGKDVTLRASLYGIQCLVTRQVAAHLSVHFFTEKPKLLFTAFRKLWRYHGHSQTGLLNDLVLQVLADPGEGETPLMPVALMHASAACVAAGQVRLYLHEMPLKLAVQWSALTGQDSCTACSGLRAARCQHVGVMA